MNTRSRIERLIGSPRVAAPVYCMVLLVAGLAGLSAITDIGDGYRALWASQQVLARLEQRTTAQPPESIWSGDVVPPGSPFLEGPTMTVASAALLERITSAVVRTGG